METASSIGDRRAGDSGGDTIPVAGGIGGAIAAGMVALVARQTGALSGSGAAVAALIGWIAVVAGDPWAAVLIGYFVATSLLSRWRHAWKADRTSGIVDKGGPRDGWQVGANGGAFAAAALGAILLPGAHGWMQIGAGALAASAADSWGTEVGILAAQPPRSVLTLRRVPPGTSGGITLAGMLASIGGAAFVAVLATLAGSTDVTVPVLVGGIAGAVADSVVGAGAQARRWCASCRVETEQRVHRCGTPTQHRRGIPWLDNDAVNLMATLVGASVAWAL